MRTIEFKGHEIAYDERCLKSYKWQKAMNSGDSQRSTKAVAQLFAGRDEEYADLICGNDNPDELDTSMEAMGELLAAVLEDMGQLAKN